MQNDSVNLVSGMRPNVFVALMNFLYLVPSCGWIISIVLWAVGKDQSAYVNAKGKDLLNWMISMVLYGVVGSLTLLVLFVLLLPVGMVLLYLFWAAVGLLSVVFPIVAGVKALNEEEWSYPLTISFIK